MTTELIRLKQLLEKYPYIKKSWLRNKIFTKKIPYLKVEGIIFFDVQEIEEWFESKRIKSKEN
jgi:hypothetical protein